MLFVQILKVKFLLHLIFRDDLLLLFVLLISSHVSLWSS